jgi:transcription termination factor Rho
MSEEKLEEVISQKPQKMEEKKTVKGVEKKTTARRKKATSKSDDEVKPVKKRKPRITKKKEVEKDSSKESDIAKAIDSSTSGDQEKLVPVKKIKAARKTVRKSVKPRAVKIEEPSVSSETVVTEAPKEITTIENYSRKKVITPVKTEERLTEIVVAETNNDLKSQSSKDVKPQVNKEVKPKNNKEVRSQNDSDRPANNNNSRNTNTNNNNNRNSDSNSNDRSRSNNNRNNRPNNNPNRLTHQKNTKNTNNTNNNNNRNKKRREEKIEEINLIENPDAPRLLLNDYYHVENELLRKRGIELGMDEEYIYDYKRQEIITEILKDHSKKGGVIVVEGTLEVLPDGYGFLRSSVNSYISGPDDIYVAANIIRYGALKTGDQIEGQVKTPRDSERFYGLYKVLLVDGTDPIKAKKRPNFDDLIPIFPDDRLTLESSADEDVSTRIIDLFCPIGKGQRALIVAPPRTGKTVLLQKIANSISKNNPEISLMVLLVDERPEEVTDMRDQVKGEVIASTFDEQASRHVQVAEMAIEKAKRMVEHGKDVVILLDSITRLARAYNQTVPSSGKVLSGGVDSNALHKPKRFFGAARNIKGGGSLTIISTALIDTGSRMDEVIFEEFKGTGNSEIILDRKLSDRRIFPSINIKRSGTRREDLLLPPEEARKVWVIRNAISDMDDLDQTPFLIDKMSKSKNNEAFLNSINTNAKM